MSLRYKLPCPHCDYCLEVIPRQAGQDLECPQCLQTIEAPKLGKMKQLETVGGSPERAASNSGGSLRNMLFVIGLLVAIVGGAGGYFVYRHADNLIFEIDYEEEEKKFNEEVDILTPGQVVALHDEMNIEAGLGEWYEPNFVRYNTQGAYLLKFAYGLFGLSGLGVLCLIGSLLIRTP